jgi:hypothetical protein
MSTPLLQPSFHVHLDGWKTHTCVECGRPYQYRLSVDQPVFGHVNTFVVQHANRRAHGQLLWNARYVPCPNCGAYQPEMLPRRHVLGMAAAMGALLGGAFCLALVLLMGYDGDLRPLEWLSPARPELAHETACWLFAGFAPVALAAYLLFARCNPNRDRLANLEVARRLKQEDVLAGDEPARAVGQHRTWPKWLHAAALLLIVPGIACCFVPALARTREGWVLNQKAIQPRVAGPGDPVRIRFGESFESVKGYARANVQVVVDNWEELGLDSTDLPATSDADRWGDSVEVRDKERIESWNRPWADIQIPPSGDLQNKTLKLSIDADIVFPRVTDRFRSWDGNDFHYEDDNLLVHDTAEIRLSSPGAGRRFQIVSVAVMLAVPGMFALAALGAGLVAYVRYFTRSRSQVAVDPVNAVLSD